jgi:hypothetical protein
LPRTSKNRGVVRHQFLEPLDDGVERVWVHDLERQVLEFAGEDRQADAACERRVYLQRLARDALLCFFRRHELDRAHIVQAVGELHEENADVFRGGEDELLEVLGLDQQARRVAAADLWQLGDAVDEVGHFPAEQLLDFLALDVAVLDHVVQQAGDDRRLIELEVGEQAGDRHGVREVRITRMAHLLAVLHDGEHVGGVDGFLVGVGLVGLYLLDKLVLTQKSPRAGFGRCGLLGLLERGHIRLAHQLNLKSALRAPTPAPPDKP